MKVKGRAWWVVAPQELQRPCWIRRPLKSIWPEVVESGMLSDEDGGLVSDEDGGLASDEEGLASDEDEEMVLVADMGIRVS